MRLLKEIIRNPGMELDGKTFCREAVRAIVPDGRNLLMIFSAKDGDYKFPGGGAEHGETLEQALAREVKEESGAEVVGIIGEFGKVLEYGMPLEPGYDVFRMTSYYYVCQVGPIFSETSLDDYEKDLGFEPVWIDIDKALQANLDILESTRKEVPRWTAREAYVLQRIKEELLQGSSGMASGSR